ncbi:MAG TPA: DUF4190 domain-containing protein [Galbitalea sp.]|jgi:hypothetical protein|nr:DUF4190 domain-containing protein [Galbitalea sp.]
MTDVVTATCASCGADIYSTKFCENCGIEVAGPNSETVAADAVAPQTSVPTAAPTATAIAVTSTRAPSSAGGTALRFIMLLFLLSTILVPAVMQLLPPTDNEYELQRDTLATLQVLTGLLALLSALPGRASGGAKFGGVLFALGYIALTMTEDFTSVLYGIEFDLLFYDGLGFLLLFLCWAVARPFRGPGYLGILFILVFEFAMEYIALGIDEAVPQSASIWNALIEIVLVLATIGFTSLFERPRAALPIVSAAVADGSINVKARASLTMALIAIALNIISRVIPYTLGVAISFCALGLLIAAIIVGHIARREIRVTNQRGSGMATAGLVIGYVILGLDIVLIVVSIVAVAAAFSVL